MTVLSYVSKTVSVPLSGQDGTLVIPLFDHTLGTLVQITFDANIVHRTILRGENTSTTTDASILWGDPSFGSGFNLLADGSHSLLASSYQWGQLTMKLPAPYDGTLDFRGASGKRFEMIGDNYVAPGTVTAGATLALMTDTDNPTITALITRTGSADVASAITGESGKVATSVLNWSGCEALSIIYGYTPA